MTDRAVRITFITRTAQKRSQPDIKHRHQLTECVLSVKAGIRQISRLLFPFGKTSVIKHLFGILNDKRHDSVPQAFLECNQTTDSAVAVLERMNPFKTLMKPNDVINGNGRQCSIVIQ